MKINLKKDDIALIVSPGNSIQIFYPKESIDKIVSDEMIYVAAMANYMQDKKFFKKIVKKFLKEIDKLDCDEKEEE